MQGLLQDTALQGVLLQGVVLQATMPQAALLQGTTLRRVVLPDTVPQGVVLWVTAGMNLWWTWCRTTGSRCCGPDQQEAARESGAEATPAPVGHSRWWWCCAVCGGGGGDLWVVRLCDVLKTSFVQGARAGPCWNSGNAFTKQKPGL